MPTDSPALNIEPPYVRQYIASPYTAAGDAPLEAKRTACAAIALAWVLEHDGGAPYSPIAHWHAASLHLPSLTREDHAMWMRVCKSHMIACSVLYILPLPGWRESVGVWMEIGYARAWGMSVKILQNTTLAMKLSLELLDEEELETMDWGVVE